MLQFVAKFWKMLTETVIFFYNKIFSPSFSSINLLSSKQPAPLLVLVCNFMNLREPFEENSSNLLNVKPAIRISLGHAGQQIELLTIRIPSSMNSNLDFGPIAKSNDQIVSYQFLLD